MIHLIKRYYPVGLVNPVSKSSISSRRAHVWTSGLVSLALVLGLICIPFQSSAQQAPQVPIVDSIDINAFERIFENLDPANITTGLLYDKVVTFVDWSRFDGSDTSDVITMDEWQQVYFELPQAAVGEPPFLDLMDLLTLADTGILVHGMVPLTIVNLEYNTIKDSAVGNGLLLVIDSALHDNPGTTESPYEQRRLLASTTLDTLVDAGVVDFWISDAWYFANDTNAVAELHIDFDDGLGSQTVYLSPGEVYHVTYASAGMKVIRVSLLLSDGAVLHSSFRLTVASGASGQRSIPPRDDYWTVTSGNYSATVSILYADNNTKLSKPFLLLDGFDPGPGQERHYEEMLKILNVNQTMDKLRELCYDIVTVDWDDGDGYIQNNAMVLVEVIQQIDSMKVGFNELVIAGPSMGGIIGRYALCYMEQNGLPHHTRLLVCFDSPHKGANIPFGLQEVMRELSLFVTSMAKYRIGLDSPASRQLLVYHHLTGTTAPHPLRGQLLAEFAALGEYPIEPVIVGVANGSGIATRQTNDQGSPMNPGSTIIGGDGTITILKQTLELSLAVRAVPNGLPVTDVAEARLDATFKIWPFKWTVTLVNFDKPVAGTQPYDNCPGGFRADLKDLGIFSSLPFINVVHQNFDFVPTVSSLDLDPNQITGLFHHVRNDADLPNKTPFGENTNEGSPDVNELHSYISMVNGDWLLDEFIGEGIPEDLFVQNVTFDQKVLVQAKSSITAGENVDLNQILGPVTVTSSGIVWFNAGNTVTIKPGFEIHQGADVTISIGPHVPECGQYIKVFGHQDGISRIHGKLPGRSDTDQ